MPLTLNLKKIRKWVDQCESATDAARQLDMNVINLHRLLRGDNVDIRISTLGRLAEAMDVKPAELLR